MAQLTREDVLKLAQLADLELSEEELSQFTTEIGEILDFFQQLDAVKTDNLSPTDQVTGLVNVMRPDTIIDYGISQAELLKNLPEQKDGLIKVKRILG